MTEASNKRNCRMAANRKMWSKAVMMIALILATNQAVLAGGYGGAGSFATASVSASAGAVAGGGGGSYSGVGAGGGSYSGGVGSGSYSGGGDGSYAGNGGTLTTIVPGVVHGSINLEKNVDLEALEDGISDVFGGILSEVVHGLHSSVHGGLVGSSNSGKVPHGSGNGVVISVNEGEHGATIETSIGVNGGGGIVVGTTSNVGGRPNHNRPHSSVGGNVPNSNLNPGRPIHGNGGMGGRPGGYVPNNNGVHASGVPNTNINSGNNGRPGGYVPNNRPHSSSGGNVPNTNANPGRPIHGNGGNSGRPGGFAPNNNGVHASGGVNGPNTNFNPGRPIQGNGGNNGRPGGYVPHNNRPHSSAGGKIPNTNSNPGRPITGEAGIVVGSSSSVGGFVTTNNRPHSSNGGRIPNSNLHPGGPINSGGNGIGGRPGGYVPQHNGPHSSNGGSGLPNSNIYPGGSSNAGGSSSGVGGRPGGYVPSSSTGGKLPNSDTNLNPGNQIHGEGGIIVEISSGVEGASGAHASNSNRPSSGHGAGVPHTNLNPGGSINSNGRPLKPQNGKNPTSTNIGTGSDIHISIGGHTDITDLDSGYEGANPTILITSSSSSHSGAGNTGISFEDYVASRKRPSSSVGGTASGSYNPSIGDSSNVHISVGAQPGDSNGSNVDNQQLDTEYGPPPSKAPGSYASTSGNTNKKGKGNGYVTFPGSASSSSAGHDSSNGQEYADNVQGSSVNIGSSSYGKANGGSITFPDSDTSKEPQIREIFDDDSSQDSVGFTSDGSGLSVTSGFGSNQRKPYGGSYASSSSGSKAYSGNTNKGYGKTSSGTYNGSGDSSFVTAASSSASASASSSSSAGGALGYGGSYSSSYASASASSAAYASRH
ncbi:uncharacterized transmembrane protein DDB_G0289901 [Musca domestica]|uniref:Uncharacterized transmembrane protein DDB_G0289901 n=1 Tax=Musca domestica TaxID=7370 RepID=A0A9J7I6G4_MUSDO|nr:uncharacterized transmembrane protein DDB_G0289901 [Musca domestica]